MRMITERGLSINALLQLTLDTANAEEFLQVYKGVVQEYHLMVAELTSGPCIAMEVCGCGGDAQQVLKELAGPLDPVGPPNACTDVKKLAIITIIIMLLS